MSSNCDPSRIETEPTDQMPPSPSRQAAKSKRGETSPRPGSDEPPKLPTPTEEKVELKGLILNAGTQARESLNLDVVKSYRDAMDENERFPPIEVYRVGNLLYLIDGFHRVTAALELEIQVLDALVYEGTLSEAMIWAQNRNVPHDKAGLKRTPEDKRRAAKRMIELCPDWKDRTIAAHIGVSHTFIHYFRKPREKKPSPPGAPDVCASIDPAGLTPEEAKQAGEIEAAAAAQPQATGSEPAEVPTVNLAAPRLSDEEFLDRCKLNHTLKGEKLTGFQRQALLLRKVHDSKNAEALYNELKGSISKKNTDLGKIGIEIHKFFNIKPADQWLLCLDCNGKGCQSCQHDGYQLNRK